MKADIQCADARTVGNAHPRIALETLMEARALPSASDRALSLKALCHQALSRADTRALPAHCSGDEGESATRIDPDLEALDAWLKDEGCALVLRGGLLIFTNAQGQPGGSEPSRALRQHVEAHRQPIIGWLTL